MAEFGEAVTTMESPPADRKVKGGSASLAFLDFLSVVVASTYLSTRPMDAY